MNNKWMGKKGFDEAAYYKDEVHGVSNEQSDTRLKEKIHEAIRRDPELKSFKLEVDVQDGVATLQGDNINLDQKNKLVDLVKDLSGIEGIITHVGL
jgi:osmotically-inducible protein OsmY